MLIRSWGLFFACWRVLRSQPSLAIYPIISGITSLCLVVLFLFPLYSAGAFGRLLDRDVVTTTTTNSPFVVDSSSFLPWQVWVVLFGLGLALNFVTNFCNAAFTAATLVRLSGNSVTVGEAFTVAAARLPAILGYSIIGATVGLILRMIEERAGLLGRVVTLVVGLAWAVATFMVVPVLVVENVGPFEGIKRSLALLKRTWGEGLVCRVGVGAAAALLSMAVVLAGAIGIAVAIQLGAVPLIALAVAATVAGLVAIGVIARTLTGIFTAALYAYATGRGLMPGIPSDLITGAFGPKGSRI